MHAMTYRFPAKSSGGPSPSQIKAIYFRFTPMVVPENWTATILLETAIEGTPTAVKLELQSTGKEVSLTDDGSGGDKVAGDGIYTVTLGAADILYNFIPDDVNRNFIGYLRLYGGGQLVEQSNIFVDILPVSIPAVQITTITAEVQYSEHLVNIVDPGFFPLLDTTRISSKFYSFFGDEYDFINIISEISFFQDRHFEGVRSKVQGIGIQPFDHGIAYGSANRLIGCILFPYPIFFDGASPDYQHELGHQWINFLAVPPLDFSIPHWPLSDLASDIMGWGEGKNTPGLEFDYNLVQVGNNYNLVMNNNPRIFSDLSLYLMGFIPPNQVGAHFVFDDQKQAQIGGMLKGPVTYVNLANIINTLGTRRPDSSQAQKKFRVATVLVSKDGLLSNNAMRLYDYFSLRAEETQIVPYSSALEKGQTNPFHLATQGLGRLDTRIKRHILVDASRDGGVWWFPQAGPFDPGSAHQGYALAMYLRSLGHMVTELPRLQQITGAILADYNIVIRAASFGTYDPAEIAAYLDYVQNGGNLLLLAEHSPTDDLATSLGLEFAGMTRGENLLTSFATHPLTNGLGPVPYNVGSALLSYPSVAQILGWLSSQSYLDLNDNYKQDPGEPSAPPVLGVMSYGNGRIVFCGDTNLWETMPQPLINNLLWFFADP